MRRRHAQQKGDIYDAASRPYEEKGSLEPVTHVEALERRRHEKRRYQDGYTEAELQELYRRQKEEVLRQELELRIAEERRQVLLERQRIRESQTQPKRSMGYDAAVPSFRLVKQYEDAERRDSPEVVLRRSPVSGTQSAPVEQCCNDLEA